MRRAAAPAARAVVVALTLAAAAPAAAQPSSRVFSQRGFVDASLVAFPQEAPNDPTQLMADALVREELFAKPAPWIQFAAGMDVRGNTHDQVDDDWVPDFADRGIQRPRVSVRRLSAALTYKGLAIDAGKQFIRWGKTDILTPTDRFAPRDYLNVITSDLLPVLGVRGQQQVGAETFEVVWVPRLTPSRVPLLDQRWTVIPPEFANVPLADGGSRIPEGSQTGVRWSHLGDGFEMALSYVDGFNHQPNIVARATSPLGPVELTRVYPELRGYGAEAAMPTRWFTIKGEAEYFTTPSSSPVPADDYVIYVVQVERQTGEWVFIGGYIGQYVSVERTAVAFAPDRGTAKSIVGRASYTIDARRSAAVESAVHQDGNGFYARAEYSETRGQHWRLTVSAVVIGGASDDFFGQYRRNSHLNAAVRYSF